MAEEEEEEEEEEEDVRGGEGGCHLAELFHALLDLQHGRHGARVRHQTLHLRIVELRQKVGHHRPHLVAQRRIACSVESPERKRKPKPKVDHSREPRSNSVNSTIRQESLAIKIDIIHQTVDEPTQVSDGSVLLRSKS